MGDAEQFVPKVSYTDVIRIANRDFFDNAEEVQRICEQVSVREKPRVILACLRIANGDIHRLQNLLKDASGYWRELISEAEYPNYTKRQGRVDDLTSDERKQIIDKDRLQYLNWLNRS